MWWWLYRYTWPCVSHRLNRYISATITQLPLRTSSTSKHFPVAVLQHFSTLFIQLCSRLRCSLVVLQRGWQFWWSWRLYFRARLRGANSPLSGLRLGAGSRSLPPRLWFCFIRPQVTLTRAFLFVFFLAPVMAEKDGMFILSPCSYPSLPLQYHMDLKVDPGHSVL